MLDTHSIKTNASKSWVFDIELARMETLNSIIPDPSFLVLKIGDYNIFGHFLAALHWQHIEKEIKEMPRGVFNFCLQKDFQKEMIRHAETHLFSK